MTWNSGWPCPCTAHGELQANVNVLTTAVTARVFALTASGEPVSQALAQAEREFDLLFPLATAASNLRHFYLLDLAGDGSADAYALVISLVCLQASHDSGLQVQVLPTRWATDFADNGLIDDTVWMALLTQAVATLRIGPATQALHQRYLAMGNTTDFTAARRLANRPPSADAGPAGLFEMGQAVVLDGRASSDLD